MLPAVLGAVEDGYKDELDKVVSHLFLCPQEGTKSTRALGQQLTVSKPTLEHEFLAGKNQEVLVG